MSDQNNLLDSSLSPTQPPSTQPAPPSLSVTTPSPLNLESPFSDPNYGRDGEQPGYVIRSHPTWSLEETQRPGTGWACLCVLLLGAASVSFIYETPTLPASIAEISEPLFVFGNSVLAWMWSHRAGCILAGAFLVMAGMEVFVCKVHKRHFDFAVPRVIDRAAWRRIFARWAALFFCFVVASILYGELHLYRFLKFPYPEDDQAGFFRHFRIFYAYASVSILILCIPYFWMVERYARKNGPCDEFLVLAYCLKRIFVGWWRPGYREDGRSALRNAHIKNLGLSMLVKFFFIPLMLTWALNGWSGWEYHGRDMVYRWSFLNWDSSWDVALNVRLFHQALLSLIITCEVSIGIIAYIASARILDTQVTTAEPTLFGWCIALSCYPPFSEVAIGHYLWRDDSVVPEVWRSHLFLDYPYVAIAFSVLGVSLMAIYAYCTFCFGMRFSNLTNRGIISTGPYRYVRHPAYISKNLAWWISVLPAFVDCSLLVASVYCFRMAGLSLIYYLRARTEEQHLMRESHYQEYCQRVRWRFIPGVW